MGSYRKAHRFVEAAQLLMKVAQEASSQLLSPVKVKKIYVLAGLLVSSCVSPYTGPFTPPPHR